MNIETLGISACERTSMLDPLFRHVIFIKNVCVTVEVGLSDVSGMRTV